MVAVADARAGGVSVPCSAWNLWSAQSKLRGGGGRQPLRRSRHASTYQIRLGTPLSGETEVFVKLLDAPRGLKAIRRLVMRSRAERIRSILDALGRSGLCGARRF